MRSLHLLGRVGADGTFTATAPLTLAPDWKPENLRAVALVQEIASHHLVGAASLPLDAAATAGR